MKHSKFAWIAAFAVSALAAVTCISCGKEEAAEAAAGSTGSASAAAAGTGNAVFDITTGRLEKGGIAYSFTDGAAAYQMVDKMFDSFGTLIPEEVPQAKEIFDAIRGFVGDEFGLKTFLGCGSSVKKNGDYYRCIDYEYAPEHKGLFWDMVGAASNGPAPELKLASPKSAIAVTTKLEPGALYAFIDKKVRSILDEDTMAVVDQQISALASSGIQPDKLLDCISGISFYAEGREFKEEDLQGATEGEAPEAAIMSMIPKFALILTTKSDLCWKALENFLTQSSPELVKDGKFVPVEGIAIFQAGNYLIATNDEAAIRDRIAGKGSDLTSNAEFAKMLALASKDFSSFSWVSEDYFKTIASLAGVINSAAAGITGGAVPTADPSIFLNQNLHSILYTAQISADGLLFTTITSDLQVALLNSGTVAGVVSGVLPYLGPIAQSIMTVMKNVGGSDVDDIEQLNRQFGATAALALLKEATIPESPCVFFAIAEDGSGAVFAKWDEAKQEMATDDAAEEFPFTVLISPEAAAKADNPEETIVFYEDPNDFFDGIFIAFGDGSVKFLEGNFDGHADAMEAAVNTFGISDKAAADLLKKAAAIDKILED